MSDTLAQRTVMVADDTPFFRKYLSDVLGQAGAQVLEAADGADLLAQLEQHGHKLDLLLLDVVMPKGNAFGLLPIIREKFTRDELKILLVTSVTEAEDIHKLRELGADGYITKDAEPDHVLFRIELGDGAIYLVSAYFSGWFYAEALYNNFIAQGREL